MLKRQSTFALCGGALAICAALFLRCAPDAPQAELREPYLQDSPPNEADALTRRQLQEALNGQFRIFDKLSGAELDKNATITQSAEEKVLVVPGAVLDISDFSGEASIAVVDGAGDETPVVSLEESTRWTGDEWHSILPYNSGLSITITGVPVGEELPRSDFYLLPHPSTLSVEEMNDRSTGPFVLDVAGMTLEGKVKWLFKKGVLRPVYHGSARQSTALEFFEPLAGDFVVLWVDNVGNQAIGEVRLVRGERSELVLPYQSRPVIKGTLLDWNGNPIPNERIKVIVSLNLQNYDYMPMDPHAFGAIRTDAEGWFHTIQLSYTTDAAGDFSCVTPRGSEYAIQSFALGSYVFWNTIQSGLYPSEGVKLEIQLMKPELAQTRVFIKSATGVALEGMEVICGLVDDLPFMRSWPRQSADAEGIVSYAGLEPGRPATFLVKHPSLRSGVYAERLTIPEGGDIRILLPTTAFRAQ